MSSLVIGKIRTAAWKTVVLAALILIGLLVGVSSVILPLAIPAVIISLMVLLFLWVLPDVRLVSDKILRRSMYFYIISIVSVPNYITLVFPGLPWVSVRKIVLFFMVFCLSVALAGSSENRRAIAEVFSKAKLIRNLLLGFYVICVLSSLVAIRPGISISITVLDTISVYLPILGICLIVKTEEDVLFILKLIICGVFINFIFGAIESYLQRPFLYQIVPASMRNMMIQANELYARLFSGNALRNGMYRATSVYSTPLSWGELNAFMSPAAAAFITYGKTARTRAFGLAGLLACFLSIVLTGSRGAYVGFILSMILFGLFWAYRSIKDQPESLKGGMAFVLYSMFSIGVVCAVLFVGRIRRTVLGGGEAQSSNDGRAIEWALAKPKILARPFLGYGSGSSGDVIGYYLYGNTPSVDSYMLTLLVDFGIPGFLCFAGILFATIYLGIRNFLFTRTSCSTIGVAIACGLCGYTLQRTTLAQVENSALIFILIGLMIAINNIVQRQKAESEIRSVPPSSKPPRPVQFGAQQRAPAIARAERGV